MCEKYIWEFSWFRFRNILENRIKLFDLCRIFEYIYNVIDILQIYIFNINKYNGQNVILLSIIKHIYYISQFKMYLNVRKIFINIYINCVQLIVTKCLCIIKQKCFTHFVLHYDLS